MKVHVPFVPLTLKWLIPKLYGTLFFFLHVSLYNLHHKVNQLTNNYIYYYNIIINQNVISKSN